MFERFQVDAGAVVITKYSYYWQSSDGTRFKRWDNAPHHPTVATHPHHLQVGNTEIYPHSASSAEEFLSKLGSELS